MFYPEANLIWGKSGQLGQDMTSAKDVLIVVLRAALARQVLYRHDDVQVLA